MIHALDSHHVFLFYLTRGDLSGYRETSDLGNRKTITKME
jgi:hypothetical protein